MTGIISKVLFSSIIIGSISGGGYGIFKALNKENKVNSQIFNSQKSKKNKLEESLINIPVQVKKINSIVEEKKDDNSLLPINEKSKNIQNSPEDKKLLEKSYEKNISSEKIVFFEEEVLEEDPVKKLNEEKEKEAQLSIQEKKEENIFLEANWIFNVGGQNSLSKSKSCLLIKNDQKNKIYPDMQESHDEINEDDDICGETHWYKWMDYEYEKEDLWIRGKTEGIKKLIEANRSNWEGQNHFLRKDNKDLTSFGFNHSLCEIRKTDENDPNWIEIKCSFTKNPKNLFF